MQPRKSNHYRAEDVPEPNYYESRADTANTLRETYWQNIVQTCGPVVLFTIGFVSAVLQQSKEPTNAPALPTSISAMIPQSSTSEYLPISPSIIHETPRFEFIYNVEGQYFLPLHGVFTIETEIRSMTPLSQEEINEQFREKAQKILQDRINPPTA